MLLFKKNNLRGEMDMFRSKKLSANFLLSVLVVSLLFILTVPASAAALTITGTGLKNDVVISDWSGHTMVDRHFSAINNSNTRRIWKVRGYDLFDLIGVGNLKTDQNYTVTFIASDNFSTSLTVNDLTRYYYSDFTEATQQSASPMLGFYRAEIFVQEPNSSPPFSWEDRAITEADKDKNAPRLYVGQESVNGVNQQYFARDLVKILVGEERPEAPGVPDAPPPAGRNDGGTGELPRTDGPSGLLVVGLLLVGSGLAVWKKRK
jgi:LPXTG-motif cell wall-anchored protein